MRKILSKDNESRKKKRNQLTVGLLLIFLMFFSTLGFAFQLITQEETEQNENSKIVNYNGFEFKEQNNFWSLNKGGINFIFRNNPNQVTKINSEINSLNNYLNKSLYIYSESIKAESEIRTNLFQYVKEIKNACLEKDECIEKFPIKTCEDNFIIIKEISENETSGINQENNCIFIKDYEENLIKLTDEFLFKLLGIES